MKALQLLSVIGAALAPTFAGAQSATIMKAVVVHEYGGPEVLKLEETKRPEPGQGQMLIRVIAAGVNPVDGMVRSGKFAQYFKSKLPLIPGYDVAGTVEKTGPGIVRFKKGDAVYAYIPIPEGGGYAEYAIATEEQAAAKPATIGFVEAAAVPVTALTAWQALIDEGKLRAGQTVLIHGGSGGVGTFAIQIAKSRGAKVFATASTANQEFLRELGADVAIDYKTQKFEEIAKEVDVVVDSVGGETLARSYGVAKKGGIIVSLVDRPDPAKLEARGLRGVSLSVKPDSKELSEIAKLIDAKKIRVIVSQVFPLAEASKAEAQADTGHTRGKIVLKVSDEPTRPE